MKYTKIDAEMEVARLRQCAKNARECAWRADRTADMKAGMAEADKLERRAAELEELYVSNDIPDHAQDAVDRALHYAQPAQDGAKDARWWALVMGAAAELETASYSISDPDAKRIAQSGADYFRNKAKEMGAAMGQGGSDEPVPS